jgi:hypothetical protein
MTPEDLARRFHDTYERLAPQFGYETRADTKAFDPNSPNGRLMMAVCWDVVGKELEALSVDRYAMIDLRTQLLREQNMVLRLQVALDRLARQADYASDALTEAVALLRELEMPRC